MEYSKKRVLSLAAIASITLTALIILVAAISSLLNSVPKKDVTQEPGLQVRLVNPLGENVEPVFNIPTIDGATLAIFTFKVTYNSNYTGNISYTVDNAQPIQIAEEAKNSGEIIQDFSLTISESGTHSLKVMAKNDSAEVKFNVNLIPNTTTDLNQPDVALKTVVYTLTGTELNSIVLDATTENYVTTITFDFSHIQLQGYTMSIAIDGTPVELVDNTAKYPGTLSSKSIFTITLTQGE